MVFHRNFCRHHGLALASSHGFGQGRSGHGARYTNLSLASTHSRGNGGAFFENTADFSGGAKKALDHFCFSFRRIRGMYKDETIHQHRRYHSRSTVGGRRHHPAKTGILFIHRQSKTTDPIEDIGKVFTSIADGLHPFNRILIACSAQQPLIEC